MKLKHLIGAVVLALLLWALIIGGGWFLISLL